MIALHMIPASSHKDQDPPRSMIALHMIPASSTETRTRRAR